MLWLYETALVIWLWNGLVFCPSKIGEAILRKIIDRRGILKNTIYIDQRDNK